VRLPALLVSLATAGTLVVGVNAALPGQAQARECAPLHGPLVAYGHSYLASPQLGGATESYATLAAAALDVRPVIRAKNGDTTADVEKLVLQGTTRWVPGTSDVVLIDSGINDIKNKVPTATWTAALRGMLSAFAARPVPVILLVRPLRVDQPGHPGSDQKVIDAYGSEQRAVADEFSAVHIVDASEDWDPSRDVGPDGVHPTLAGEQQLARAVRSVVTRTFCAD
jgi:lysophospholipase L1-like esterase